MDNIYIISRQAESPKERKLLAKAEKYIARELVMLGFNPIVPNLYYPQFMSAFGVEAFKTSFAKLELMNICKSAICLVVDDIITPEMHSYINHLYRKGVTIEYKRLTTKDIKHLKMEM